VHGERGEDPTEPRASSPYPWPAVSHEPRIQKLSDDFAATGLKPFHVPVGVMLDEKNPHKSRCIRCNTCDGFPCLVYAKADAQVLCVDEAVKYPNVTLLTNSLVTRLETDSSGREVSAVVVERDGREERFSAEVIVVSCGAINSAALLLRSASDRHPQGLANSSDVVGRHYMGHTNSVMMAISKCPNPTVFQKTLGVNDFYFGSEDFQYPMGHISFVGKLDAVTLRAGAPAIAPNFTLELMAKHSLDFWLTSEDLPDPNNRVTVDRDGKIVLSYTPNNLEARSRLQAKLKDALKHQSCPVHGHNCQFIVTRRSSKSIIAGYPWFTDWGRDTMIALPGLTLATGRYDVARSVLQEFARYADRGMLPNRLPDAGETPEYNTRKRTC
jgi:choline dehydrogenase-like flavoprotein